VDEEDDDEDPGSYYGQYQRTAHQWFPAVTEPQEAGLNLLMSGEFGRVGQRLRTDNNMDVTRRLRDRATTPRYSNFKEDILSVCSPTPCELYCD
jgi:WD repeat-containing protein 23